jgi:hypothetical protein
VRGSETYVLEREGISSVRPTPHPRHRCTNSGPQAARRAGNSGAKVREGKTGPVCASACECDRECEGQRTHQHQGITYGGMPGLGGIPGGIPGGMPLQ